MIRGDPEADPSVIAGTKHFVYVDILCDMCIYVYIYICVSFLSTLALRFVS